jgi:hypothetical protein
MKSSEPIRATSKMLMTAASFTIALDAVRDSLVESSAAGPGTLRREFLRMQDAERST